MNPYLSIIIPCYEGSKIIEKQLPLFIFYLKFFPYSTVLIVVDDASKDGRVQQEIIESNGGRYLRNTVNVGKGASVLKGMLAAQGQCLIFTDADISFEYEAISRRMDYLDCKEFHLVIGDRNPAQSSYFSEIRKTRKLGSEIFPFIVGRFVTSGLHDTQCGLKGFRAEIANDLFSVGRINGFTFDVEILYVALKRNYDIKRLPVSLRNQAEETTVSLWRRGPSMMIDLFTLKINYLLGLYDKRVI